MEQQDLLTTIAQGQAQAEIYFSQGNLTEATNLIQSLLNMAEPSAKTWKILGNIQQKQGRLTEAKNSYLQAIQLDPNFFPAYANLGSIYALEEAWLKAIEYYQQAIQLQPDLLGVYRNLAKIWQHLGNDLELYKCHYYILIYQSEPVKYFEYAQLGHKLLKLGEKEKAIDCYEKCLLIHPTHCFVLGILGDLAKEAGELDKALNYYEQALENHVNQALISVKIGDIYLIQNNLDQALFYFLEGLKYKSDLLAAYRKVRIVLEKQGKLKDVVIKNDFDFPGSAIADWLSLPANWSVNISSTPEISHELIYPHNTIHGQASHTMKKVPSSLPSKPIYCADAFVSSIPHGTVHIDYMNIVFKTNGGQILPEISVGLPELIASLPSSHVDFYPGKTVILSCRWQSNYFHWMFDIIARMHLLLAKGLSFSEINQFVVNNIDQPYCQETLEVLGVNLDQVICSNSSAHIQSEYLIVPSYPFANGSRMAKWACQFLQNLFIPRIDANFIGPERIYISRSRAGKRRILNEDQVIDLLEKKGFVTVFLESMSVLEQASYFAHAKVIIATHGAGLTNLLFARSGTKVIEIFLRNGVSSLYWQLCQTCHLSHYHLVQNGEGVTALEINNQDFFVNIHDLTNILDIAEIY